MRSSTTAVIALFSLLLVPSCRREAQRGPATSGVPVSRAYRFPFQTPARGNDQPGAAAAYELARRTVEGEPIPLERYQTAWRHRNTMRTTRLGRADRKPAANAIALGSWEQLGPGNIAGISRSLVIDPRQPDTMYTTGVSGGIWKTTDAGANWRPVGDLLPILVIGSLAIDPSDSRVLYAGTGDGFAGLNAVRGAGIYKSTDAGENWTLLPSTSSPDFTYVNKLIVSPNIGRSLYAATNAGVMRSADGGATWTRSLERGLPGRGCQDLALRTDFASDYIFASCGIPGQRTGVDLRLRTASTEVSNEPAVVFLNKAAAANGLWTEVLSGATASLQTGIRFGRTSLALSPSNQSVVYAVVSVYDPNFGPYRDALLAVYRSSGGGEAGTWQPRVRNDDRNRLNTLLLSNPFYGACLGNADSAGQAWHDNTAAVDPVDPNRLWVGGIDLFRSDDGGQNFGMASLWWINSSRREYVHADHHAVVFHPRYDGEANRTMFTVTDGGVFRTSNARASVATGPGAPCDNERIGVNWEAITGGLSTLQFYSGSVYPGGGTYLGGAQDNGSVRGSEGAGFRNWQTLTQGDGGRSVIDPLDPNIVYQAAQSFDLDKSIDGGGSFQLAIRGITEPSTNFAFVAPFAADPKDSRRLWSAGTRIWTTTNAAEQWVPASPPALAPRSFTSLAVSPHDSNLVLAGARSGEVFRTNAALTATAATAWDRSLPRVGWVSSIAFDPRDRDVVYAAYGSFNRAPGDAHVYRSADGGATWSASDGSGDTALPDAPFHSIAVNPVIPSMLVAAGDLGVFVSMDDGLTWSREDDNLPAAVVNHVSFEQDPGGLSLYAFTFGRGLWRVRLATAVNPCQYTVTPPAPAAFSSAGGVDTRTIETSPGCPWTAVSSVPWIKVASIATGAGAGSVRLLVDPNVVNPPRTGQVTIAGTQVAIRQDELIVVGQWDEWQDGPIYSVPFASGIENISATTAVSDPIHGCVGTAGIKTIWWRFTAPFTGAVSSQGTGFRLDIFGNPVFSLAAFEINGDTLGPELACGFNASPSPGFVNLTFPVTQGRQYALGFAGLGSANPGGFLMVAVTRADTLVDFAPKEVDFGEVRPGETVERRLVIRNAGNTPLTIPAIQFADTQFSASVSGPIVIDVRSVREVLVRFTARTTGPQSASLRLSSSAVVPLRAQVASAPPAVARIRVEPETLEFGAVAAGEAREREIVVRNAGAAPLTVESAEVTNGVFAIGEGGPFVVAPGEGRRITVRFAPPEAGAQVGRLEFRTNDPDRPAVAISLSGEGQ